MSDYILTYSKTKFYPLEPNKEDIKIIDIVHALSLMTRANGHFKHFYSVAQHSINCYKEAKNRGYSKRVQLGCLLHDASESYISDLTRPVKKNLPDYFDIEENLQGLIYEKYGLVNLTSEEIKQIKDVDDAMLYFEFLELMEEKIFDIEPFISMKHDFSQRDFIAVENEFIYFFQIVTGTKSCNSFVGVDGCKEGYVAVNITDDSFNIDIFKSIEEICFKYRESKSVIIDMPIGLPENEKDIRPEAYARKILSSRASCVFNVPCRQAVYKNEYHEANEINKRILGKGLSKQSFAIFNKIREIDEFLHKESGFKNKIIEGHPEVCFAMLNYNEGSNKPIYENKKTKEGIQKRLDLLEKYYDKTREIENMIFSDSKLSKIKDDVIDALCLAVVGRLGIKNGFKTLPENPMKDDRGIEMQMVYSY